MPLPLRTIAAALTLALGLVGPALAQTVSERPDAVAVTIYRDGPVDTADLDASGGGLEGLALITETRIVDIPAGRVRVSFRGVADGIVPQTAAIEGVPGVMLERNQDYDLLSPGSLIAKSVGKTVRLVRTNPGTGLTTEEPAVIRSGPDGVMLDFNGRLEALRCGGLPEHLIFDEIPAGLSDRPTLSVLVRAPAAGRYKLRLTYLAVGLNWSADYVARIRPDGKTLDLTGWITLANGGGASFANAPTQVVAGNLQREDDTEPTFVQRVNLAARCWPLPDYEGVSAAAGFAAAAPPPPPPPPPPAMARAAEEIVVTASRIAVQSELGDYKLYTLPDPTTVSAHQTKQVMMLEEQAVPFERVYVFDVDLDDLSDDAAEAEGQAPRALLRLTNTRARGLGKPLPGGAVSVMEPGPRGGLILAGEKRIKDIAVGLPVEIELGEAMDVTLRPRLVRVTKTRRRERRRVEALVANDKAVAIVLEIRQARDHGPGFRIVQESMRHHGDRGYEVWTVRLAPGERKVLTYTVDVDLD